MKRNKGQPKYKGGEVWLHYYHCGCIENFRAGTYVTYCLDHRSYQSSHGKTRYDLAKG